MSSAFDDQLMYKLATIETKVASIGDNLTAAIGRIETRIADVAVQSAQNLADVRSRTEASINSLEEQLKANERRISRFEDWKNIIVAKIGVVAFILTGVWALFGNEIQNRLGTLF